MWLIKEHFSTLQVHKKLSCVSGFSMCPRRVNGHLPGQQPWKPRGHPGRAVGMKSASPDLTTQRFSWWPEGVCSCSETGQEEAWTQGTLATSTGMLDGWCGTDQIQGWAETLVNPGKLCRGCLIPQSSLTWLTLGQVSIQSLSTSWLGIHSIPHDMPPQEEDPWGTNRTLELLAS